MILESIRKRNGSSEHEGQSSADSDGTSPLLAPKNLDEKRHSTLSKRGRTFTKICLCSLVLVVAVGLVINSLHGLGKKGKSFLRLATTKFWNTLEKHRVFEPLREFDQNYARKYPELQVLEENHAVIRQEAESLLKFRDQLVPLAKISSFTKGALADKQPWKTFFLQVDVGGTLEQNAVYAPRTAELLKDIPGVYTAFFSILDGNSHLIPHWGYYKGFVRYHLGVIVPNNNNDKKCWIRFNPDYSISEDHKKAVREDVDNIRNQLMENQPKYYWKEGEGVMFDDNYLHEAANESDEPRVVLFLDVARKMPWYANIINKIMLRVAMNDSSMASLRKNAVVKLQVTDDLENWETTPAN